MTDARVSPRMLQEIGHLPVLQQSAALCYRMQQGQPEVLLITTRKSGRWIIPKGSLIAGLTASQTARQEAWEEAGVLGNCVTQAMGRFLFRKHRPKKGATLCVVDVFPLSVQSTATNFPECGQRRRKWFSPKKAALRVNSPELAILLQNVEPVTH